MDPATIIALISAATTLGEQIAKIIAARRQSGELTPEEEKAWREFVTTQMSQPQWQLSKP